MDDVAKNSNQPALQAIAQKNPMVAFIRLFDSLETLRVITVCPLFDGSRDSTSTFVTRAEICVIGILYALSKV